MIFNVKVYGLSRVYMIKNTSEKEAVEMVDSRSYSCDRQASSVQPDSTSLSGALFLQESRENRVFSFFSQGAEQTPQAPSVTGDGRTSVSGENTGMQEEGFPSLYPDLSNPIEPLHQEICRQVRAEVPKVCAEQGLLDSLPASCLNRASSFLTPHREAGLKGVGKTVRFVDEAQNPRALASIQVFERYNHYEMDDEETQNLILSQLVPQQPLPSYAEQDADFSFLGEDDECPVGESPDEALPCALYEAFSTENREAEKVVCAKESSVSCMETEDEGSWFPAGSMSMWYREHEDTFNPPDFSDSPASAEDRTRKKG